MSVTAVPIQPTPRRLITALWAGLVVLLVAAVALAWFGTSAAVAQTGTNDQFLAWNARQPGVQTTASGLQYQVVKAGEGEHPTDADVALVNMTGTLRDGTVFQPTTRGPLEVGATIPGFSEALKQMQKGGKYRLWIKPELGYGDRPTPGGEVPPNSLLKFDIELVDFIPAAVLRQQMQMQQMMGGGQGGGVPGAPNGR